MMYFTTHYYNCEWHFNLPRSHQIRSSNQKSRKLNHKLEGFRTWIIYLDNQWDSITFLNLKDILLWKRWALVCSAVLIFSRQQKLYLLFSKNIEPCSIKFRFIFSFRFIAWYNQFQLLIKGNMRYDYLDCFEKFEVTKLPPLDNPCDRLKAWLESSTILRHIQFWNSRLVYRLMNESRYFVIGGCVRKSSISWTQIITTCFLVILRTVHFIKQDRCWSYEQM